MCLWSLSPDVFLFFEGDVVDGVGDGVGGGLTSGTGAKMIVE